MKNVSISNTNRDFYRCDFSTESEFKCHNKIDMAILLDSSASLSEKVFEATKSFASDLVKHFEISKDKVKMAVVSYSQYVHIQRRFCDEPSQEAVLKAIDGICYEGSFTRLDSALDVVHYKIFKKEGGARSCDKGKRKIECRTFDWRRRLKIKTCD